MQNIGDMMKQVQQMQSAMQDMQARLENETVTGQAGGGLVKVEMNGKGTVRNVSIDPELLKPDEVEILEDLLVAAHADARTRVEKLMADNMKELTGGMPLPPGFQMPG